MSMDEFIPPGFVPLANWDSRHRRNNDGHTVEWKLLSDAVKDGEIPGFKLSNGRWYVHERASNEHLTKAAARPESPRQHTGKADPAWGDSRLEAAVVAMCEINNGISLMHATLERLVAAVESIATQPKAEAVGSWRDMSGESV